MSAAIHQEVTFKASPDRIYNALLSSEQFSKATGGAPTDINAEEGGTFSCFGGMILGRNIELVPNKRIVQAWRVANWEEGVYSVVKFELKEQGSETLLVFDHSSFPEGTGEHLATGWHDNYWKPIEKLLA
ncbi:Activator of Hsp90 ATPase homolog 1-like protein [Paenibacillus sp. yr247]|uniref:SRPBCC family protein n=1 Tax=Paenibacillus sp. yr247 TaxID=1761880 RepID=UPI000889773F|nr:SRPBCC family protein [Paenibacillus sp. yr247]SDN41461.1 Activator of Hsp90 ATPase homolog 1-like protein [Paenibacillus sp. yr247]